MTPQQTFNQIATLSQYAGVGWFDNNAFASEYLYPESWSPWDWVQFGGTQLITPLQNGSMATLGGSGPFTFLGEVTGKYEIHIDKKPQPGKPQTNTVQYVDASEVQIKLYIITPYDLIAIRLLIEYAGAIFPADAPQADPTVVPIFHPKLNLFVRNRFILSSMSYVQEPRDGKPAYVDTVWIPQDEVKNQNQIGTYTSTGFVGETASGSVAASQSATPPGVPPPS